MLQIRLLDGGLGTTLEAPPYHVCFGTDTPLWSSHLLISDPTKLQAAHKAFLDAGADILLTATYQTSTAGFTRTDASYTPQDAARYMRSAIPLAWAAIASLGEGQRPRQVALSLGPYGATTFPVGTEYTGLYPPEMDREDALREWHAQRLKMFIEGETEGDSDSSWDKIDYVAFETVLRQDEVRAVRGAMFDVLRGQDRVQGQKSRESKPWWICGVFPAEEVDEDAIRKWVDAALAEESGFPRPWGIGLNCVRMENVAKIVSIMQDEVRRLSEMPQGGFADEWDSSSGKPWLVLYPDGTKGEKYDQVTKTWVKVREPIETRPWDEAYWDVVQSVSEEDWEGLVMGGCCRAGPAEISALRRRIDAA
ncbi:hypothetical protein P175DRAFT_0500927 [Aspergillus ochraceoroseus IBT 24754]|nr:uncharacterized protein P175DRAFT_0500927 [Aspergillus ochraceoroseus IBT 24754]KKK19629.1 hypothetical protein AOCH_000895 [Aspergillus ochraceoroseus]PTU22078.1 hypothetical protein P175DRAFT_0500927 [Aspergillus ochraceoroseus IBT 24754]